MYTVATYQLAKATGLDFLLVIPRIFVYIALAVLNHLVEGAMRTLDMTKH